MVSNGFPDARGKLYDRYDRYDRSGRYDWSHLSRWADLKNHWFFNGFPKLGQTSKTIGFSMGFQAWADI